MSPLPPPQPRHDYHDGQGKSGSYVNEYEGASLERIIRTPEERGTKERLHSTVRDGYWHRGVVGSDVRIQTFQGGIS